VSETFLTIALRNSEAKEQARQPFCMQCGVHMNSRPLSGEQSEQSNGSNVGGISRPTCILLAWQQSDEWG